MYWLYIYDDVFIWNKKDEAYFYNSSTCFGFMLALNEITKKIVQELTNPNNLYCIEISQEEFEIKSIKNLLKRIESSGDGILIPRSQSILKPISFVPILRINKDFKNLCLKDIGFLGEDILKNLKSVSLRLNGSCDNSCSNCERCFLQFPFCTKTDGNITLDQIESFINEIKNSNVSEINLLGGDLSKYQFIGEVVCKFSLLSIVKIYYLNILNTDASILNLFDNNTSLLKVEILIELSGDETIIIPNIRKILAHKFEVLFCFVVASYEEFTLANNIVSELNLAAFEIKPVFNEKNEGFFQDHIFTNISDIERNNTSKREVFIHQTLNINDFGKLHIMPNGFVFANLNCPPLGSYNNNLTELVYKEMIDGKSWFNIRNNLPCINCVYQWLCPSPSNYETVIRKSNLCNVVE
jgi:pseudo-rSAM protein